MDLMVRDLLQVGQGLPAGRVVFIPSGPNAQPIRLPGPPGTAFDAAGATELSAVTARPGAGPVVNGRATDVLMTLAVDSAFDEMRLTAFDANGGRIVVGLPGCCGAVTNGLANITDGGPDDITPGDLLMLKKSSYSTLVQVTRVVNQQVFFDAGDSLNLNQGAGVDGTGADLFASAPETYTNGLSPTMASRVRMITYYVDATTDPARPRLVRRMNNGDPVVFSNLMGTVVAFDIEGLQITYDLADGVNNPANVRFDAADLDGTGACNPDPCSTNNVRKVNVALSGRSRIPMRGTQQFFRNTLVTQVSLRSLAFVDRYR
jgi:hypothetical protein